jgi:hypothetical protein
VITRICLVASVLIAMFEVTQAQESAVGMSIALSPKRTVYKPGDKLTVDISYQNHSRRPIRFLPTLKVYPAAEFGVRKTSNGKIAKFHPLTESDMDAEQWAKEAIILRPGQTYVRHMTIDVTDKVVPYDGKEKRGLFLVFPISALELPGLGQYRVTAIYDSIGSYFLKFVPDLWQGKMSSSVVVSFRK